MDYVIDTNYLRSPKDVSKLKRPELGQLLEKSGDGDRFILTDTSLLETMKNQQWESTLRASFRIISEHASKMWMATAPSELVKEELKSGQDTTDVVNSQLTKWLRSLLSEIISNDGITINTIRTRIQAAQNSISICQQDHTNNLSKLKQIVYALDKINFRKYRKCTDEERRGFRLSYSKKVAIEATRGIADQESTSLIVERLASGRGAMMRMQIGYVLIGLKWAINGGLNSLPDFKATNELMALDQALISTYCDSIFSEETKCG